MSQFHPPVAAAAIALLAVTGAALANCTLDNTAVAHVYWSDSTPTYPDNRCNWSVPRIDSGRIASCHLTGWLVKPPVSGVKTLHDMPAMVYLHGSGYKIDTAGMCEIINRMNAYGFVVWVPYMRGVRDDSTSGTGAGFQNTGVNVLDYASALGGDADAVANNTLDYMNDELYDVGASLKKLIAFPSQVPGKPLVDPDKIAIMGHSYGGMLAMLATSATFDVPVHAVAALSPGSMSWGSSTVWATRLGHSATNRRTGLYFQTTAQESPQGTIDTLIDLAAASNNFSLYGYAQGQFFSSFPIPPSQQLDCNAKGYPYYKCSHIWFTLGADQVNRWLPGVRDFFAYYGVQ